MGMNGRRLRARSWKCGALQAATIIAVAAGWSTSSADEAKAPVQAARADVAQSTSEDPCRYFTAQEMGKAFGRPMKSSKLANVCEYRGTEGDLVVVKVATGPEGTIPAFIGRVGNHEVQIETTIQPVPREAMIAVGVRIMETLARK